jgi:methylated-DNA-[protein]-cysteine S-methyltransferase
MAKNILPFKDAVKEIVRNIPKGKVLTYKEVAIQAGNPLAARAVARIMSVNYDPTVPCHRVICSNGQLGGYNRGGTIEKRRKLIAEGINV